MNSLSFRSIIAVIATATAKLFQNVVIRKEKPKNEEEGFTAGECKIDGKLENLAQYVKKNNIDTKMPLVADYSGTMINVSIQEVKETEVNFYAPVFSGVEYRFATPVDNYVTDFQKALPSSVSPVFACNCILNFLYSDLEGKKTEKVEGPIAFGEIAYQLLNQTLAYLEIVDN